MSPLPIDSPLWLASRSQRRRQMLAAAGVDVRVRPAAIDDGSLQPGDVTPAQWVMALAYLKGRCVVDAFAAEPPPPEPVESGPPGGREPAPSSVPPRAGGTVLAADTVCVHGGRVFGQPAHRDEARAMLHALRDNSHVTMTGVCVLSLRRPGRWMLVDRAEVHCDHITDGQIEGYLSSDLWRGKAGAYNLEERTAAGWPISCAGDPATVMGLPMRRLRPWLRRFRGRER